VRKVRPQKRIIVRLTDGKQETHDVPAAELQATMARITARGVADLTVEDPPLEDVMRDLFDGGKRDEGAA
jgi:hypothetical protein